jgi:hypothetical protein
MSKNKNNSDSSWKSVIKTELKDWGKVISSEAKEWVDVATGSTSKYEKIGGKDSNLYIKKK